jgi:hypothetical protein
MLFLILMPGIRKMKNQQKIKKIHLPVNDQDKPVIIGIVSPDQDYKLSLKINRKLSFTLRNIKPVEIEDTNGNTLIFSRFAQEGSGNENIIQLISNRSEKSFLLSKLRNIDYIMLVSGLSRLQLSDNIIPSIREIDSVSGVFRIDLEKILKEKNLGLLF